MSSKSYSRVGAGQLRLGCSGKELTRNLSIPMIGMIGMLKFRVSSFPE